VARGYRAAREDGPADREPVGQRDPNPIRGPPNHARPRSASHRDRPRSGVGEPHAASHARRDADVLVLEIEHDSEVELTALDASDHCIFAESQRDSDLPDAPNLRAIGANRGLVQVERLRRGGARQAGREEEPRRR
jgi:hypothetical protein